MEIDKTRYGYIYRITNLVNGKTYIGRHKIKKDESFLTYMGSGRLINSALAKYGRNNFLKEILEYAETQEELSTLELVYIEKEIASGHSEYNIDHSGAALKVTLKNLEVSDEDLLKWYFDENMSYMEIALRLDYSYATIYNYMKKLRNTDERFKNIKQGDNRGKGGSTDKGLKRMNELAREQIKCKKCGSMISKQPHNYAKHLEACSEEGVFYDNGVKKRKCAFEDCETLVRVKNKHCKEHHRNYIGKKMESIKTPESMRKGGLAASHKRHHVEKNRISETCELCVEDNKSQL